MAIPTQGQELDGCGLPSRFSTGDAGVAERTLLGKDGLEPEFQLCDFKLAGTQTSHKPSLGLRVLLRKMETETPRSQVLRTK